MSDHPTPIASAAPSPQFSKRETDQNYLDAVATLKPKLRVIGGSCKMQWVIQWSKGSNWLSIAFCQTKEGLLQNLKDMLLEDYLSERDAYVPQQAQVFDAKKGRTVKRPRVSREALDLTAAARAVLKAGDVCMFDVDPAAWRIIEALPDRFPGEASDERC